MTDPTRGAPDVESDPWGTLPVPDRDLAMVDVLRLQRAGCLRAGSVLYGKILGAMIEDVRRGGPCQEILDPWRDNAMADAVPLRFLAAVHTLVLEGSVPELACFFPSAGGTDDGDPSGPFLEVVEAHRDRISDAMSLGVQTNEVGRAAALLGGFHLVSRRTGLPLRCLEVGASAGLLLRWDHYCYRAGLDGTSIEWGDVDDLVFEDPWVGSPPRLDPACRVAARRGCDIAPIDPTTEAGVVRLRSFLWPDQRQRRSRLDAAIEVARRVPAVVDRADAGDWAARQLAEPATGQATILYHSIVLQYLPRATFDRMRDELSAAGERATPDAPLLWLRMEPAGPVADLRLRSWSGGEPTEELLGTTGYHGPPVTWTGP